MRRRWTHMFIIHTESRKSVVLRRARFYNRTFMPITTGRIEIRRNTVLYKPHVFK